MASYRIEYKTSVFQDFKKIDRQFASRIFKKIESLALNPHPHDCKKLVNTEKTFRIRIGDYRAVYQIDEKEKIIVIQYVRHRKDVYRDL